MMVLNEAGEQFILFRFSLIEILGMRSCANTSTARLSTSFEFLGSVLGELVFHLSTNVLKVIDKRKENLHTRFYHSNTAIHRKFNIRKLR